MLVVPTVDDVFAFERELCGEGAALGGTVLTFGALFGQIATAAGRPPGAVLSPAQRRRCVEVAVEERAAAARAAAPLRRAPRLRRRLRPPARRAAGGRGRPAGGRGERRHPRGLRLPRRRRHPLRRLRGGPRAQRPPRRRRDRPRGDRPAARRPRAVGRPAGLPIWARRPHPGPVRPRRRARRPHRGDRRGPLRGRQRGAGGARPAAGTAARRLEPVEEVGLDADPGNTESAQLYALARGFGFPGAPAAAAPRALRPDPAALRRHPRRGRGDRRRGLAPRPRRDGARTRSRSPSATPAGAAPRSKRRWRRTGSPRRSRPRCRSPRPRSAAPSSPCSRPPSATARAADLLRYLRGPSGFSPGRVDWLERAIRRERIGDAETALARWRGEAGPPSEGEGTRRRGEDPRDLQRLREAAAESPAALCAAVAGLAATMASRPFRTGEDGPRLGPGDGLELRAAGSIAAALSDLAALGPLAPAPERLAETVARARLPRLERPGRGPGADRQPLPPARRPLRPRPRRLAAGRRVPAPRPRRRPLPLRGPARTARPRPAPRHRSRGALPLRRLPGAAAPPPLPLLPRQRRERGGGIALAAARGGARD